MDIADEFAFAEKRPEFGFECLHNAAFFFGCTAAQRAADQTDTLAPDSFQIDVGFSSSHRGDHDPAAAEDHLFETVAHKFAADAVQRHGGRIGFDRR